VQKGNQYIFLLSFLGSGSAALGVRIVGPLAAGVQDVMNQFESVSVWFPLANFDFNDLSSQRFDDFAIYQIHDFISAMVPTILT